MLYKKSDSKRPCSEVGAGNSYQGRTAFRRDYGRLLHSPSFRRLQGKTQLFPGHENDFFRNRLTHSLEVAQIAKSISLNINQTDPVFRKSPLDTDLVELAALAHDLGHPPFGHNGEKALDDCMKQHGGFEGNAQTIRLLTKIEKKVAHADPQQSGPVVSADYSGISRTGQDLRAGLNLTYRSIAAVLKYDRQIPMHRPVTADLLKGYYESESALIANVKTHVGDPPTGVAFKTVECQIMDLADDIAYSTYDLEDAMKGGFTHPLAIRSVLTIEKELVRRVFAKVRKNVKDCTEPEVFETLQNIFDLRADETSESPFDSIQAFQSSTMLAGQGPLRVGFTSRLVDGFMKGVQVEARTGKGQAFSRVFLTRQVQLEIESLKHLNYEMVIMSPRLKVVEHRGYGVVKTIFERLSSDHGHLLLPEDWRMMHSRLTNETGVKRLICDFVAGMTDRYAIEFYSRLSESGASIFKPL